MSAELIPSPPDKLDEKTSKKRTSKTTEQPTGQAEPERPKAARRPPQMPTLAELVEQMRHVAGLVALGIMTPAQANIALRCISKTCDIVMRCQTSASGAPNQPGLVEACRQNPKLVHLLEPLLTDDQLTELLRQVTEDGGA